MASRELFSYRLNIALSQATHVSEDLGELVFGKRSMRGTIIDWKNAGDCTIPMME